MLNKEKAKVLVELTQELKREVQNSTKNKDDKDARIKILNLCLKIQAVCK